MSKVKKTKIKKVSKRGELAEKGRKPEEILDKYRLTDRDKSVLELILQYPAIKSAEIAKVLKVKPQTVYNSKTKEAFKKALSEFEKPAKDLIKTAKVEAARVLIKQLRSPIPKIAQDAAKLILGAELEAPTEPEGNKVLNVLNLNIKEMATDKLVELAQYQIKNFSKLQLNSTPENPKKDDG